MFARLGALIFRLQEAAEDYLNQTILERKILPGHKDEFRTTIYFRAAPALGQT